MNNLQNLLKFLIQSPLDFVIVGGFAAVLHGCNQSTRDIDICVSLSTDHLDLIRKSLAPLHPRLRDLPDRPLLSDWKPAENMVSTLHLETDLGVLDIISHIEGVGNYLSVLSHATEINLFDSKAFLISLDDLIKSKKALGRHRDLAVVEELEQIKIQQKI